MGIGWSIGGYGVITRCRRSREAGDGDGYQWPGIDPYTDSAYCLDGQRLIQISNGVANGTAGAEYRTEIDAFQRIVVETSESISLGSAAPVAQPLVWVVRSKDGTVRRFGEQGGLDGAQRARNAPPSPMNVDPILSWLETTRRDTVGNVLTFDHARFDVGTGSALGAAYDHYLEEVRYVGGRIAFTYVERGAGNTGASPFDRQYIGFTTVGSRSRRLSSVEVFASRCSTNPQSGTPQNCGGETEATPFRTYRLTYESTPLNPSRDRLASIQECGKGGVCLGPTSFTWAQPSLADVGSASLALSAESESIRRFGDLTSMKFGDFNGDGRTDIYWTDSVVGGRTLKIAVSTADGSRFLFTPVQSTGVRINGKNKLDRNWHVFDFNADGLDDVVYIRDCDGIVGCVNGWHVALAQPVSGWINNVPPLPAVGSAPQPVNSAFLLPATGIVAGSPSSVVVPLAGASDLNYGGLLADLNGDGLLDLVYSAGASGNGYGLLVRTLSRVDAVGRPFAFSPSDIVVRLRGTGNEPCAAALFDRWNIERFEVQDFNGDGVGDLKLRTSKSSCASNPLANAVPPADAGSGELNPGYCGPGTGRDCTDPIPIDPVDPLWTLSTPPTTEETSGVGPNANPYYWTLFTNEGLVADVSPVSCWKSVGTSTDCA